MSEHSSTGLGGGRESLVPGSNRPRSSYRKVTITLPPEQEAFLARFALELRTSGGRKLATTEIVRGLILALQALSPDLNGIRSEEELAERIIRAVEATSGPH
jgi:hypothetical protein